MAVDLTPKSPGLATVEAPRSSVSIAQIVSPYEQLAHTEQKLSDAAETAAIPLAEQAGYQAVTRDAAGNVQVEKAPIVGPASQHYTHAVKIAALAEGEGAARRADIEMRQKFRDDPAGYLKAATAHNDELQKQYAAAAGPEVGVALRRSVELATTQTYRGLLNEKERLDLIRSVQTIDSEIETTKNQMYAMARGGVTSGHDWDMAAGKVRALYSSLGSNPRLAYPKAKIDYELAQFDSELRVQGLAHHIVDQVYQKDGPEAAAKAAESIRTDPKLNLWPAQRDASYNRVMSELGARVRDDLRVKQGLGKDIDSVGQLAIKGYTVPPEQIGALRAQIGAKAPELSPELDRAEAVANTMKQWATMSPAQLEASVRSLDRAMQDKGASDTGLALKKAGEDLLKNMRKEVGADPLGWADRTGTMAVPAIDFGTLDAPSQMSDRANRAEIIAKHYGVAPTYLRPDEVSALQVAAAKGGDTMLSIARTLVDGFGDRASRVMAEISSDAPSLAHVGALMQSGGNQSFAVDVADAVKLRQDKDFKIPRWMDHPADKIMAAQGERAREVYGDAFTLAPDSGRAAQKAAQDAFFTRANRNGYVPLLDNSDSKKAYDRALQESAGAKFVGGVQYGGIEDYHKSDWFGAARRVMVPANVRADKFRDAIGAITDDDLSKMPIAPQTADIRAAVPVATKGGYRFSRGDPNSTDPKWIPGADGKPFVLDFDQMEERLRARVPGAFLGSK